MATDRAGRPVDGCEQRVERRRPAHIGKRFKERLDAAAGVLMRPCVERDNDRSKAKRAARGRWGWVGMAVRGAGLRLRV